MTNLGNLYYTLGLDTASFLKKIKSIDPSLSDLKKKIEALGIQWADLGKTDAARTKQSIKLLSLVEREQQKITREVKRTQQAMQNTTANMTLQKGSLSEMVRLAGRYVSVLGAVQLVKSMVQITGEFEMQRTTMAAILRDAQAASQLISQIKELAVISPFQFKELTTYAKQLSAYSIPKEEIYETTRMLADVSAGIGVDMQRLILAYGQIRSASFLRGQEVRQLTESGIPVLTELAKQFTQITGDFTSAGEVFDKISNRQVPFEMIEKMFKNMTSEGGKFYQMQEIQASTLKGKISNLKDAWDIMLNDVGESNIKIMKNIVDWIRKCIQNVQEVGKTLIPILATTASLSIAAQTVAFFTAGTLASSLKLFPVVRNIKFLIDSINAGKMVPMVLSKIGLIVAALAGIGTLIWRITEANSALRKELSSIDTKYNDFTNSSVNVLEKLRAKLKDVTEGSQAWRDTISQLNSQFGEHLRYIITETEAIEGQKSALQQLEEQYESTERSVRLYYERARLEDKKRAITKAYKVSDKRDDVVEYLTEHLSVMNDGRGVNITESDIYKVIEEYTEVIKGASEEDRSKTRGGSIFDSSEQFQNKILYEILNKTYKGTNFQSSTAFSDVVLEYVETVWKLEDRLKELGEAGGYSFYQEGIILKDLEKSYQKKKEEAYSLLKTDQKEYDKKIKEAEIYRLKELMRIYAPTIGGEIDKDLNWANQSGAQNILSNNNLFNQYQSELRELMALPDTWKQEVGAAEQKYTDSKNKVFVNFSVTKDTKLSTFIDDLRKKYKENKEDIEELVNAREDIVTLTKRESMKASNKAIEELFTAWGLSLITDKDKKKTRDKMAERLELVRDVADLLKEMMNVEENAVKNGYTKYTGGKSDLIGVLTGMTATREGKLNEVGLGDFTSSITENNIGNIDKYKNALSGLVDEINGLVGLDETKKRAFEEYVLGIFDKDVSSDYNQVYKAAKDLEGILKEFAEANYMPENAKIEKKVAAIANNLRNELNKISIEQGKTNEIFTKRWGGTISTDSNGTLSWMKPTGMDEVMVKQAENEWETLLDGYAEKRNYATWQAQNKVNELAKTWGESQLQKAKVFDAGDTNFDRLSNMSTATISKNIDAIIDLVDEVGKGSFDVVLKQQISGTKIELETLKKNLIDFYNNKTKDLNAEKFERIKQQINSLIQGLGSVADSLGNLGEVTGNETLINLSETFNRVKDTVVDIVETLTEGFKDGATTFIEAFDNIKNSVSFITMIIKIVLEAISWLIDSIAGSKKRISEVTAATLDWANALQKARIEAMLAAEAMKNVFGADSLGEVEEWSKAASEAINSIISNEKKGAYTLKRWYEDTGIEELWVKRQYESLGNSNPYDFQLKTAGKRTRNLRDAVPELFIGDRLNYNELEAFVNSKLYEELSTDEQRAWFDTQLELWNNYKEAIANIASYLDDVFGNVADNISSKMLDAFMKTGNAAIDMGDIISGVAKTFAQDMIKSFIMEEYFNSASDAIKSMSMQYNENGVKNENYIADKNERVNAMLGIFLDAVTDLDREGTSYINQLLEGMKGWLGDSGSESAGTELAKISEDTGGLIASYVNAVRAYCASLDSVNKDIRDDVSNIHLLMIEMASDISDIRISTSANAVAAEEIKNFISRLTTSGGALKLNVRM